MNHRTVAEEILSRVGGKENVEEALHCMTRLRLKLTDKSLVDTEQVKKIKGVISVVDKAEQYQIVIGNEVGKVYNEFALLIGESVKKEDTKEVEKKEVEKKAGEEEQKSVFSQLLETLSSIFVPTIGVMAGSGILKGLLALFIACGWITTDAATYQILNSVADTFFYFFPIFLGFSAGKRFGCNPFLTAVIGAALVYPSIVALGNEGTAITFFGIDMVMSKYTSTVFPIIIASWVASKVEKFLNKVLPSAVRLFLTPLIVITGVTSLTYLIIGPASLFISNLLASGSVAIYNLSPILAGVVLGGLWQVTIIFGFQWAFLPIFINNVATYGFDLINPLLNAPAYAQAGAALGVALAVKMDKELRSLGVSSAITGLFGVTEPAIYGVTLPRKYPFVIGCIWGAIGGAIAAICGTKRYGFGVSGVFSAPLFISPENGFDLGFWGFVISIAVGFVGATITTYIVERKMQRKVK